MGFFTRKNKSASSPARQASPVLAQAARVPAIVAPPAAINSLKLRVLVDGAQRDTVADPTFYVHADPDAPASSIKQLVEAKLGTNVNAGCYKVAIPFAAVNLAREYTERFGIVVNFISVFPSFNLHDPEQIALSFGSGGRQHGSTRLPRPEPLVRDWFPLGVDNSEGQITILARTVNGSSSSRPPLTLLAHFAPSPSSCALNPPRGSPDLRGRRAPHCKATHAPSSKRRHLPIPIDVSHDASVAELKRAVLRSASVDVSVDSDKVIAWQVDMSPEEMIVIEERGGLKHGQMPWPYPPTALVPVVLSDASLPLSRFFTNGVSNTHIVSLSIWIHPSIAPASADDETPIPTFHYPMNLDEAADLLRTPSLGAAPRARSSRARPSTAPAAVLASSGTPSVPAFGTRKSTRSTSSHRPTTRANGHLLSPLATTSYSAGDIVGLGIAVDRQRLDSISSSSANDSSDSEGNMKSVLSSRSSIDKMEYVLKTPREELPSMLLTAQRGLKMDYFTRLDLE